MATNASPKSPLTGTRPKFKASAVVMDDQAMVGNILGKLLSLFGVEAVLVENGEAVLELYKQSMDQGMPYDLIFLDLVVERGMGGLETFSELKENEIDNIPGVVLCSGQSYQDLENHLELGFCQLLIKPYCLDEIEAVLTCALGGSKPTEQPEREPW